MYQACQAPSQARGIEAGDQIQRQYTVCNGAEETLEVEPPSPYNYHKGEDLGPQWPTSISLLLNESRTQSF